MSEKNTAPAKPAAVPAPAKIERTIKVPVPTEPNLEPHSGAEFPATAVLVYANGVRIVMQFRAPKPSNASGKINCWAGGVMALEDGTQVRVGINLTVED